MKRRILPWILAVFSVFLFAGCAQGEIVSENAVFRMSENKLQLAEGEQHVLTLEISNITFSEGEELVWSTSAPQVAEITVDAIKENRAAVRAVGSGGAVISATAGEYIQVCAVTVTEGPYIRLKTESLQLFSGRTAMLETETNVNGALSFTSDEPAVASVNPEGLVSARAGGTAHITVSGGGASAVCTVTVIEPYVILDQTAVMLTLEEGNNTVQLTATSNGTVTWSSTDGAVASVEGGLVTAHAVGEAVITASYESAQAECTVKVKGELITLALSESEHRLEEHDSFTLTATLTPPQTGEDALRWEVVSGEEIVSVDENGTVASLGGYGEAVVRATLVSDPDVYAECTVTVPEPYSDWVKITDAASFKAALSAGNEGKNMYLDSDIDLGEENFTGSLGDFTGIFDGRGYTVTYRGGKLFANLAAEGVVRRLGVRFVASTLGGNEGIFGMELLGTVENCRIEVEFGAVQWQAAFARNSKGTVRNTVVLVRNPKGTSYVYAGTTQGGGTWENCYYAVLEGTVGGNGPMLKTEDELKASGLYTDWDGAVWDISEGSLPALKH